MHLASDQTWLHPNHQKSMRNMGAFLLLLAIIQLLAWLLPSWPEFKGIPYYLPLHVLLETASIIISMMVFVMGWNSLSRNLSGNIVLLACAYFAVGILDFLHTISYGGMPDYISPNDAQKHLNFWLSARLLASFVLLVVALRPWTPLRSKATRYLILGTLFALTFVINWIVVYHQTWFPDTFIAGQGLTAFKKNFEYTIIAINVVTALILWSKMRAPQTFNVVLLFGAVCTLAMSEFFFTLYTTMTGSYNVLGHIYKVISYIFIYRAIVVEVIEEPYSLLEQTQQKLSMSLKASNTGLWSWNLKTDHVYYSPEWKAQLGYLPDDLPDTLDTWKSLLHPDDREGALDKVREYLASSELQYENEFRLRHRDGEYRWIMARGEKQFDTSGKVSDLIGSHIDITERKQAEVELRKYQDHLEDEVQLRTADLLLARNAAEAANKAKSVFLSSMSHELRTPLNSILGFSNILRQDPELRQEQRDNLGIINRSGEHLLTLINDVLEMAKIEAGRVEIENAPFDIGEIVRDVTDMMHMRAQERGLQLLVEQSSEFPRFIKGDEARLRQVLINLVGNAVKFTQEGGVTVRFGMKPHTTPPRLMIEVEDSGPGIKPEDQQRIFLPFVQLSESTMQKGTGLGLTITQQYVKLMGGDICVESTLGVGSIFRVELPAEMVSASEVVKPECTVKGEVTGLAPDHPEYRVLIVEDQVENQLLLARLMKDIGIAAKVAENGEQAVNLFQTWAPHLIWMDRRMPVMDGIEATQIIRQLPGGTDVKIVAVTASAFAEQRNEMLEAGMDDFIRKPYRFSEIYESLAKHLGVRYVYANEQGSKHRNNVVLTTQMLSRLPTSLRNELHDALESLEEERIHLAMEQVATCDPTLHQALSALVSGFDYPTILKALQDSHPEGIP
ncbi:Autoinducer 2 sensor kinase/phosphatase LuxQ [Ferriphaselus amnicola]|uniref:Virulence sensor protein BvgS n=2 Tax=Ferriphaselus amnicola TaxID=1188319 RepID=A0A2Z6GE74_9PROT|nr:Autoinducer 2 sensor kinase/phosphatase LuxQ [Ferriphaselus amnicola]